MTTILITGANRGIGLALAETFIARGDRVIATMRDPFRLPDLLKTAPRALCAVIGMEVTDQRSVDRAAASVKEPIDVLINNAGVYGSRTDSSLEVDLGTFAEVLAVNTLAPIRVARAFLPQLRQSKAPRILTISSQMGALSGSLPHLEGSREQGDAGGRERSQRRRDRRRGRPSGVGSDGYGRRRGRPHGRAERQRSHRPDRQADAEGNGTVLPLGWHDPPLVNGLKDPCGGPRR
jgi:NAD(P)-dependent dehydrogenase (short-subunit alcohol dehydrogenase family)